MKVNVRMNEKYIFIKNQLHFNVTITILQSQKNRLLTIYFSLRLFIKNILFAPQIHNQFMLPYGTIIVSLILFYFAFLIKYKIIPRRSMKYRVKAQPVHIKAVKHKYIGCQITINSSLIRINLIIHLVIDKVIIEVEVQNETLSC